jgi:beta-glucosidase
VFFGYRNVDRSGKPPLFPFGFGLSYTTFEYENLRLSAQSLSKDGSITVSFDIVNTGQVAGAESAQIYIGDLESSLPRPVKELKDFQKTTLQPGERKTVSVKLTEEALKYYDPGKGWVVEPGDFHVLIGASSADIRLSGTFQYRE